MQIDFKITTVPKGIQQKYFAAYLEGSLQIMVHGRIVFNQPEILLVEFASAVKQWLHNVKIGNFNDFIYESMDHEEPILLLKRAKEGFFYIESIWEEEHVGDLITINEIISAFEKYLEQLKSVLLATCSVSLDEIIV